MPMVIFLCIRCCGQHRSLGTHVSKPRSVDLDTWTPQSIKLASAWGNHRANAIWEKLKDPSLVRQISESYASVGSGHHHIPTPFCIRFSSALAQNLHSDQLTFPAGTLGSLSGPST